MLPLLLLAVQANIVIDVEEPTVYSSSTGPVAFNTVEEVQHWLVSNNHLASDLADNVMNRIRYTSQMKTLAHQFISSLGEYNNPLGRSLTYISSALSVKRTDSNFIVEVKKVTASTHVNRVIQGRVTLPLFIALAIQQKQPIVLSGEELNSIYNRLDVVSRPLINQVVSQLS